MTPNGCRWRTTVRRGILLVFASLLCGMVIASAAFAASDQWSVAFSGYGSNDLWEYGTADTADLGTQMMPGTSPSIAQLSGGGYVIAYVGTDSVLYIYNSVSGTSTSQGVGVIAGTSPSVTSLPNNGYQVAFVAYGSEQLWTIGSDGWSNTGLGVAPGTSPSIAGLTGGGYQIAFVAYGSDAIWSIGTMGWTNEGLGAAPTSSPSIAALPNNGYQIAFRANTGQLWSIGSAGWSNTGLGIASGSSASITGLSAGGYEIAFQAYGSGDLWTYGNAGSGDQGVGLAAATSPSIAGLSGNGYEIAFHAYGSDELWTVGSAGWADDDLGLSSQSSPAIAGVDFGTTAGPSAAGDVDSDGATGDFNADARRAYSHEFVLPPGKAILYGQLLNAFVLGVGSDASDNPFPAPISTIIKAAVNTAGGRHEILGLASNLIKEADVAGTLGVVTVSMSCEYSLIKGKISGRCHYIVTGYSEWEGL